jgi:hypothetical protein
VSSISLIQSEWPLVVARWPSDGELSDIDAYFDLYPALIRRARLEGPIVFITDLRKMTMSATNATKRKRVADRSAETLSALRPLIRREAVLASSSWAKASLTAVFMFSKPEWPLRVFTDEGEARAWLAEAEAAVQLTPPVGTGVSFSR